MGQDCRAIWGLGPDDQVDINVFWAGIHPDSVAGTRDKLESAIDPEGDGHFDGIYHVQPLYGSPYRWVHATGQTIFRGEGAGRHAVHVIGTVQDITDRKLAEESLRGSEERFRSVLDNSQDVIYRLNIGSGRYEYISPSVVNVVGFSPD